MSAGAPRIWFNKPCIRNWYGWRTLLPFIWGNDEWHRRDLAIGWSQTGRIVIALWHFNLDKCDPEECGGFCDCGRLYSARINDIWECGNCDRVEAP